MFQYYVVLVEIQFLVAPSLESGITYSGTVESGLIVTVKISIIAIEISPIMVFISELCSHAESLSLGRYHFDFLIISQEIVTVIAIKSSSIIRSDL